MKNAKIAAISAVAAFALSLALGFAGRVRLPSLLVRPVVFAAIFFAFVLAVTGFLLPKTGVFLPLEDDKQPENLGSEDAAANAEAQAEATVGTKLDISVGDDEEDKGSPANTGEEFSDLSGKTTPPPQEQKSKTEAASWKPPAFPAAGKEAAIDKSSPIASHSREGLDTKSKEVYNEGEPVPVYSASINTVGADKRAAEVVKSVGPDQVALAIKTVLKRDEI